MRKVSCNNRLLNKRITKIILYISFPTDHTGQIRETQIIAGSNKRRLNNKKIVGNGRNNEVHPPNLNQIL